MTGFTLACAQYPIDRVASLAEWQAKAAGWVAEAAGQGAKLLVFPEYGAMELAAIDPASAGDLQGSLRAVIALGAPFAVHFAALADAHQVAILAPSIPCVLDDGRVVNRAQLIMPDGRSGHQDKIVMTRFEREHWNISGGDVLRLFRTPLGPLAISTCYDIEFPLIARAQAEAGAQLILCPSCTDSMQGYWRVRIGAQARALENQLFVAQAPTVGMAPWSPAVDENYGAAALYGPPDGDGPDDGVLALGREGEGGWVYAPLDLGRVARWRTEGAVRPYAHWPEQMPGGSLTLPRVETVILD